MSVTRVGSTKTFAENWDDIFGGKKGKKSAPSASKPGVKKSAKKKAPKKSAKSTKTKKRK